MKNHKGSRARKTTLDQLTLAMSEKEYLTCARCKKQVVLATRHTGKTHSLEIKAMTNKVTKLNVRFDDLCSSCLGSILAWVVYEETPFEDSGFEVG